MKTSIHNNWKKVFKTTAVFAIAMMVSVANLSATETEGDSLKTKEEISKEEVAMVEELLEVLEQFDEMENIANAEAATVEVYNNNDELVFTGTSEEWNAEQAPEVISIKRKAELLFEMNGNSIYKVF